LVFETYKTSVLLRIPADSVRGLGVDMDFKCDSIILTIATFRIQHLIPIHEMAEAPIVFLAEKQVLYLTRKVFDTFLLRHKFQIRNSITGPRGGLGIAVALKKES